MGYPWGTMRFLKENWIWIVAPVVIFAALVGYLYLSGGQGSDDPYVIH